MTWERLHEEEESSGVGDPMDSGHAGEGVTPPPCRRCGLREATHTEYKGGQETDVCDECCECVRGKDE